MRTSRIASAFGFTARTKREYLGLTQAEVAKRASMHRTHLVSIEQGHKELTLETASKLADVLDLSLDGLRPAS